jgi:hypothetical protein
VLDALSGVSLLELPEKSRMSVYTIGILALFLAVTMTEVRTLRY